MTTRGISISIAASAAILAASSVPAAADWHGQRGGYAYRGRCGPGWRAAVFSTAARVLSAAGVLPTTAGLLPAPASLRRATGILCAAKVLRAMSRPSRTDAPDLRLSRAEYRLWSEQQPTGRFERIYGIVVAIAPERAVHNRRKAQAWAALRRAVQTAGLPCEVYTDGMTVEVGNSDYEPDVVLHCGKRLPDDALAIPDPLVIVEVLSPSTSSADRAFKLGEYFRMPSLRHYLIIWADKQQIVHHRRRDDSSDLDTRIAVDGDIILNPPGITVSVYDIYAD